MSLAWSMPCTLPSARRITVTAAHQSAGEPPSRWLDVADERLYLAPELGGDAAETQRQITHFLALCAAEDAAAHTSHVAPPEAAT